MKQFAVVASVMLLAVGLITGCSEAVQVAKEEFGPRAMLEKYEWFKNASAQLDAKVADIDVFTTNIKDMQDNYDGVPRKDWDRFDKQELNVWKQQVAGLKASYNLLSAEYNAQMAKFNWRFANAGTLPEGADRPLPREYKPYLTQ